MSTEGSSRSGRGAPTFREIVTPLFRYRRAGIAVALSIFGAAAFVAFAQPKLYEADMKILVKRERVDPPVSGDPNVRPQVRPDVTEDELYSEVELLKSRDLLEAVVVAAGLADGRSAAHAPDARQRAVQALQANLRIAPVRRTTFIRVSYRSSDPLQAEQVLSALARLYPEKHLALHRPPGAYEFFSAQAERFRQELDVAAARLSNFGREQHVVSAELEKQSILSRLADFEAELQHARGAIADAHRRLAQLEAETDATPVRQTTQIRTADNGELVDQLHAQILALEIRQADMLRKFTPTYPPAVDLAQELTRARAALQRAEQSLRTEQTTDQNPTHQWLMSELVRVRTERAAARARAAVLTRSISDYREKARRLDEMSAVQQNLTRALRSAEENYELYRRKQEEARIADALDRTQIVNVSIAEAPAVPSEPSTASRSWLLVIGALMALIAGAATTYLLDYISPYLRTPVEVESALDIPVLATLPAPR